MGSSRQNEAGSLSGFAGGRFGCVIGQEVRNALCSLLRPRRMGNPTQKADGGSASSHDPPDGMGCLGEAESVRLTDADNGSGHGYAQSRPDLPAGRGNGGSDSRLAFGHAGYRSVGYGNVHDGEARTINNVGEQ